VQSRPAHILLAETPGPTAEATRARLVERGYLVESGGCDETQEKLDDLRPDLAIVRVAPLEASDAARKIEEIGCRLDVPIVFLGAPADLALVRRVQGSNVYGYLTEPFDELELELILEAALDRHRTERNLREREQWLRAILRSIGHGVVATDSEWRVRYMNPAAEELTGWIGDEAIGRTLSEVVPVSISAPELIRDGRAQGMLRHRAGKEVPIEESSTTIRNESGKVIGSVIAIRAMVSSRD
jgi:PAS domain S-box-containing protein